MISSTNCCKLLEKKRPGHRGLNQDNNLFFLNYQILNKVPADISSTI